MTELAHTLAAIAGLDLGGGHARATTAMLRDRLDHGAPAERAVALVLITELEERAAPGQSGWFPGVSVTAL